MTAGGPMSWMDPGNHRFLTPFSVPGMGILLTVPVVGTIFMDAPLREEHAVETIWMVQEVVKASIQTYKILADNEIELQM